MLWIPQEKTYVLRRGRESQLPMRVKAWKVPQAHLKYTVAQYRHRMVIEKKDSKAPLLTTFSTRLGRTTLARGILTGSLLGCTVLRGILMGRLVIVSPLFVDVLSLKACKHTKQTNTRMQPTSLIRTSRPCLEVQTLETPMMSQSGKSFSPTTSMLKNARLSDYVTCKAHCRHGQLHQAAHTYTHKHPF